MVVMAVIIVAADTVVMEVIEQHNMDIISLCNILQHNLSSLVISALTLKKFLTLLESAK